MISLIGNSNTNSINADVKQNFKQKYSANSKSRSKEFEKTSYKNKIKINYKKLLYGYKYLIVIIILSFVLSIINSNDLNDYRNNKLDTFKPVRSWVGKGKHI